MTNHASVDIEQRRLEVEELEQLRQWKQSAMDVFAELDLQAMGKELDIPLGLSISQLALGSIRGINRDREQLRAKLKIAIKGFEDIIQHVTIMSGTFAKLSGTIAIAAKALEQIKKD